LVTQKSIAGLPSAFVMPARSPTFFVM